MEGIIARSMATVNKEVIVPAKVVSLVDMWGTMPKIVSQPLMFRASDSNTGLLSL